MPGVLGVDIAAAGGAAQLVGAAEVVVTTTPSRVPVINAGWLHAGLHVTAMGSDRPEKQELDPNVLVRADRLVCDLKAQCFRLGELHHAMEAGLIAEDHPIDELGELTAGRKPGRSREEEITVCDLTGVGVQDTAIALLACRKAEEEGLGLTIGR
jgi:ornithine cyclodeaminase/alanine dehydrogenase-like protein (mu-crystallin family)